MMMKIEDKLSGLEDNIKKYRKVLIAFSGGSDSTFLLTVCVNVLGKENVFAVTASSETYTEGELKAAKEIATELGVKHYVIDTDELGDELFSANPPERCYHCKKNFYSKVLDLSKEIAISAILDGSNADDASDYRPGRIAAAEFKIKSPLIESGLSKEDIRALSRGMNLPTWNKPANPCLASRIPYGSRITKEKLLAVNKAEEFIRKLGFAVLRVRHHNDTARIEIPVHEFGRFMKDDIREEVYKYLKNLGFIWVTIDIAGFESGNLNKAIGK